MKKLKIIKSWAPSTTIFVIAISAVAEVKNPNSHPFSEIFASLSNPQRRTQPESISTNIPNAYASFGPYQGSVVSGVDTKTLYGKVMCGYQGWFGVPGDGNPSQNWRHWTKHYGSLADDNAKVDLWPDVSELAPSERFQTGFKLPNGQPAEVFSSYEKPTVLRHFQWMQDYNIDGAFVQRFASELHNPHTLQTDNTVLANCREGANTHGRAYAVMYDLSGLKAGRMQDVMNDWRQLRKNMKLTDDPAYLHHRSKPVVGVWGVGFNDNRQYTLEECRTLIDFFKNDPEAGGCTVMVGVPTNWRELNKDAVSDPDLLKIIATADVVSPWTVGRYTNSGGATKYAKKTLTPDLAWCQRQKIDCMPVVFPGFSWYNMYGKDFNLAPRVRGQFLWSQFLAAKQAGASMIYVAMFDEVDEGTAIFKCANDVPSGQRSKFLNLEGLPSDFYLKLVGAGAKLIQNKIPFAVALKIPSALANFWDDRGGVNGLNREHVAVRTTTVGSAK